MNHGALGCSCNTNIPYYKQYSKFLEICDKRNVKLLDSEEEYIEKTKQNGNKTYLKLQCNICSDTVTTTTINSFVHNGALGCNCSKYKVKNV